MTNDGNQDVESIAQALVDDAPHYVASVSALMGHHESSALDDIVSSSGVKLVARGMKIDDDLRAKLCDHQLSGTTLERSLAIAGSVTAESLAFDIGRLIDNDAWFKQLTAKSGDPGAIRHGVSRVTLPHDILFRLTVAREQRPELYRHTLSVTIIAHYLALRLKLKQKAIDCILIAALCHDLGELYTDPAILEPGHRITDEERRYIYVHPITGWLILKDLKGLDPEVARSVIQHQERLDGSGYPNGLTATAIGMAARILAAADISASVMARFSNHSRLSMLLRLNSTKYDRTVVDLLHEAILPRESSTEKFDDEDSRKRFTGFAYLLDGWSRLRADTAISQTAPVIFLAERMYSLRTIVLASGFDPDSLEMALQLAAEDSKIATELAAVINELRFQLADLEREIDRRATDWLDTLDPIASVALNDWRKNLHDCNQD